MSDEERLARRRASAPAPGPWISMDLRDHAVLAPRLVAGVGRIVVRGDGVHLVEGPEVPGVSATVTRDLVADVHALLTLEARPGRQERYPSCLEVRVLHHGKAAWTERTRLPVRVRFEPVHDGARTGRFVVSEHPDGSIVQPTFHVSTQDGTIEIAWGHDFPGVQQISWQGGDAELEVRSVPLT